MSKVLVTGVTGRVGANLAASLMERGYEVRGMVMPDDPAADKLSLLGDIEVAYAALTDQEAIADAVAGIDYVAHLAAQMIKGNTPLDRYFDVNTMGTMRLLEACARSGHPVKRFVFASTDSTYNVFDPDYQPIDENHPQLPGQYYGASKVLSEQLVRNYGAQWDLPYTIVRYGSVVSVDDVLEWFRYDFTIGLLKTAEQERDSHIWRLFRGVERPWELVERAVSDPNCNPAIGLTDTDGRPWALPLTDVRDTVEGTILALEKHAAEGEAFNIMGPRAVGFDEAAGLLGEALDIPAHLVRMPMNWRFEVSCEKARRMLGYEPKHKYKELVESAMAYRRGEDVGVLPALITT